MCQATSLFNGKEVVPGYRLKQLRGRGGFGSVWEAETPDGRTLALKFLPCEDRRNAAQEVRSTQIVSHLCHPNLISIDQVWCHGGYVVVTMPLADGSLYDLLDAYQTEYKTALVPVDLCNYLTQAAKVLDFLNARQHGLEGQRVAIQHCDVKPTNLLLFGETVKLCDFGLSCTSISPLRSHRRAGTLDYAAPEIFQGRLSDWSDQYSLAVSYIQLRTGLLPFPDSPRKFDVGYMRPAPDLSMLPSEERPILSRALAAVPQQRWPTCGEMMSQLSRLLV